MILGRPTNLWLGTFTAIWNVVALVTHDVISQDVVNGVNIAAGAVILLIASQPPTVKSGDTINVKAAIDGNPTKATTVHN